MTLTTQTFETMKLLFKIALTAISMLWTTDIVSAQFREVPFDLPEQPTAAVQPWTGIVLWSDNDQVDTDAISLEYAYVRYDSIVNSQDDYDWSPVEKILDDVAGRSHQAILRFHFVYPGKKSAVPNFIQNSDGYQKLNAKSEGKRTGFSDWSSKRLRDFTLDFYTRFAKRYDSDPRLAYLQTGFGLWAEYHIYDGPNKMGKSFPSKDFQAKFVQHLSEQFKNTPWSISVDAADDSYSPFEEQDGLRNLPFGLFDDSFLCKEHKKYNEYNWGVFGKQRWQTQPCGGELNYYTNRDQKLALAEKGPHGESFESAAKRFHITYMIGNDQPEHQSMERVQSASAALGYRLAVKRSQSDGKRFRIEISNQGIAPPYHDCFVAVGGKRCEQSLKGLLPGETRVIEIPIVSDVRGESDKPEVTIESDRLVPGQSITLERAEAEG